MVSFDVARNSEYSMKVFLICALVSSPVVGLLITWATLYPSNEIASLAILTAAALSTAVLYKSDLARRRALASAVLLPSTPLYPLFAGKIGALISSVVAVILVMPPVAFFTLRSGVLGWMAVGLLVVLTCTLSAIINHFVSEHTRSAYTPAVTSWAVTVMAAVPIVLSHSFFSFHLSTMPNWIDEPSLIAMLSAAGRTLPHSGSAMTEMLSIFLYGDVLGYWLIKLNAANSLPLISVILLRDSLVFFGLASILAGFQTVALSSVGRSGGRGVLRGGRDV